MASVVMNFLISAGASVLDIFTQPPRNETFNEQIIRCNPGDNVFEEFDSLSGSCWKARRGSLWSSFVRSLWISLQITFMYSFCVGLAAFCIILTYIVMKSKCDPSSKLHVTYNVVEVFFIYFWHPLLLLNVFRGQFVREANVFTVSLFGAMLDITIRLFLALFDAYELLWKTCIGAALYLLVILVNSFNVGRKLFAQDKKQAAKVAFKFSAQFSMGTPAFFLGLYVVLPAYVNQQDGISKLILLGIAMLLILPIKVVSRYSALSLEGVNHPGNSFLLVAAAYGCSIIVFRVLQAEEEAFTTFIGLSVVHGVFHLVEVLLIKLEGIFARSRACQCFRHGKNTASDQRVTSGTTAGSENEAMLAADSAQRLKDQENRNHAQLQRFLADTIIQGMLFETTALIISVSITQLYGIINATSMEESNTSVMELVKRIYAGVFIELGFNVCCVLILTRYLNIPIFRVWQGRWKAHVTVFIITTVMSLLRYAENMVDLIKNEHGAADADCDT